MVKTDLEPLLKLVLDYIIKKEYWKHGYIKYSIIKRMIIYVTKIERMYIVRKIFVTLTDKGYIIRKRNKARSYLYKFKNPNGNIKESKTVTITFD